MEAHADDHADNGTEAFLMRVGFTLDGDGSCIAEARRHATAFLETARTEHHLPVSARARDLTELVVSELVTNAVKYAPGPVLMELRVTADMVDVVIRDGERGIPAVRTADPGRVGQHGLEIIKAVAEELFIEQEAAGKRITARIALADTLSPA